MPRGKTPTPRDATLHEHRLPDPTEVVKGEFAKSRVTRTRIMEAAVECLAKVGYSSTSTSAVAKQAGLTRAAMLYHFPSRMALIEATVHYVTRKRVEMYGETMTDIPQDEHYFEKAMEIAWAQLQTPEFLAFDELSTAARTDPDLAEVFAPALAEFDRSRRDMALKLFPKDHIAQPWFDLRRDIVRFLLEGLAHQGGITFDAERRTREIIAFLQALATDPEGAGVLGKAQARAGRRRK